MTDDEQDKSRVRQKIKVRYYSQRCQPIRTPSLDVRVTSRCALTRTWLAGDHSGSLWRHRRRRLGGRFWWELHRGGERRSVGAPSGDTRRPAAQTAWSRRTRIQTRHSGYDVWGGRQLGAGGIYCTPLRHALTWVVTREVVHPEHLKPRSPSSSPHTWMSWSPWLQEAAWKWVFQLRCDVIYKLAPTEASRAPVASCYTCLQACLGHDSTNAPFSSLQMFLFGSKVLTKPPTVEVNGLKELLQTSSKALVTLVQFSWSPVRDTGEGHRWPRRAEHPPILGSFSRYSLSDFYNIKSFKRLNVWADLMSNKILI